MSSRGLSSGLIQFTRILPDRDGTRLNTVLLGGGGGWCMGGLFEWNHSSGNLCNVHPSLAIYCVNMTKKQTFQVLYTFFLGYKWRLQNLKNGNFRVHADILRGFGLFVFVKSLFSSLNALFPKLGSQIKKVLVLAQS